MYGAPERELLQSHCERKEWTICDGKTVPQPAPATGAVTATKILAAVKEQASVDLDFVLDETHLHEDFLQADV